MLFLLAMEPLHRLFQKVQDLQLLDKLTKSCEAFRMSFYADHGALFIRPSEKEFLITIHILKKNIRGKWSQDKYEQNRVFSNSLLKL
jgi:hypothetical protein